MCSINRWVRMISCNISRPTQHTNAEQVPACSQESVDCGDFNLFGDNTVRNVKFHCLIIDRIGLAHVQLRPRVFKVATATKIYCKLGRCCGIVSMLKSLQKQLQRRYTQQCLKIDTLLRTSMFFGWPF